MNKPNGNYSVAFPKRWWYPVCRSSSLRRRPRAVTLMDRPLALFRATSGRPAALLDRCAHRNAPLSLGSVQEGCVRCPYHGWTYDGEGRCRDVPGLLVDSSSPTRDVEAHAATEQDGFVWVWGEAGAEPTGRPFPLPKLQGETVFPCDLDCTLHAALENTLDVPHTAFLHRGIFRGVKPKDLKAVRRNLENGCEVEFVGESVGLGRIQGGPLASKVFQHWDRFFMPSIAQVEYRVEDWLRIYNTVLHLPVSPFKTRAWFVLQWSSPVPAALIRPIVQLRGRKVLRQDAAMLARQSERTHRFGGERFSSTELDVLGSAIWRLLRQAERAEQAEQAEGAGASDGAERDQAAEDEPVPDAEVVFRI